MKNNLVHHHISRQFGRDERKDRWTTNATPPKREAKPVGVKVIKKGWGGIRETKMATKEPVII